MQSLPAATIGGHPVLGVLEELVGVLERGLCSTEAPAKDGSASEARRIEVLQLRRCIRALIAEAHFLQLECLDAKQASNQQPQLFDRIEQLCCVSQSVLQSARDCVQCAAPPLTPPPICVSSLLGVMPEEDRPAMPVTFRAVASTQSTGGVAVAIAAVSHAQASVVFEPAEPPQRTPSASPPTQRVNRQPRSTAVARPSSIVVQRAISIEDQDPVLTAPMESPPAADSDEGDALTLGVGVGLGVQLRGQQVGARHVDEGASDFHARQVAPRPPEQFADRVSVGNPVKVDGGPLGSYTVYTCTVERRNGPNIVVQRRYSDFVRLRERLMQLHSQSPSAQLAGVPELPEKRIVGRFNAAFVEKRRQGLEEMLTYIVKNRELSNHELTRQFFLN